MMNSAKKGQVIVAPVINKAASLPKVGCRLVTIVAAYPHINKYGVTKAHVEFDYKGFVFGQNFDLDSDLFKELFPEGVLTSDIGKKVFVEIALYNGKLTGKQYPKVVGKENA